MAEEERIPSLSEKDGTDTSQSKDTYIPEEPMSDISISLLDIQMPETPDSTKGQTSDGDTSRLESPKTVKPVLGKVQAKKRLMAFANQFKALPKSQIKPNLSQHSIGALKIKDKTFQDDVNTNKSKKKTEEKILAIEEIRREESKSKMLLAEAMAAASMEDENHTSKNTSGLLESTRYTKEKNKHEKMNNNRKTRSIDQKHSERHRYHDKINKDSSNQDVKDRNGSIEHFIQKSSQNREKHKKKKNDKDKRDNNKTDLNREKKEEGKDKKEKEKQEEVKGKTEATKNKKENIKERRNDMSEMEVEGKDKKDKDKWKEKMLLKSNSWAEVRKSGLTLDDIIHLRRRDNSERSAKIRTTQDYTRHFEQMLMLSNHRLKRQALVAEGLDGPKKYPPESIKLTKRARGLQLLYCENPRTSLLLSISQLLQAVTPERREKIRDICEASLPRIDTEDTVQQKRNWYQQINKINYHKDTKWQMTIQLPKSKWDSEDEEMLPINVAKEEVEKPINKPHISVNQQERCSTTSSITDEDKIDIAEGVKENKSNEKTIENTSTNEDSISSLLQSAGNEKLASEYEQFMKMVCTATDVTKEYSSKKNLVKSISPHSYHEFNIESNLAENNTNIEISLKEKFEKNDKLQTFEGSIKSTECEESTLSTDCQIQVNESNIQIKHTNENDESENSKSIPSDWENVRIKDERLSDENIESREIKKTKKKKMTSSSDSSSTTTSSDSEKKKKRRKHKRKVLSNSSSDSDSMDSSSSSSDSSSSEERRKRKRKKKKIGKKRKKAKRTARIKKKRRRKINTDSNSSDSDELTKNKKRTKKKTLETKSINNEDISKMISKSPIIDSSSDGTSILQSVIPARKIKEESGEDRKKSDEVISKKVHDNECLKQKKERKESKPENFIEQWEMDSSAMQNDGATSSQDRTQVKIEELGKMDDLEKDKYRRKRKHSRDNVQQDKGRSSKVNEEKIHEEKARSDEEIEAKRKKKKEKDINEEIEAKRKKRKEKDIKSGGEFLANWERESERITQQIQNEVKYLKKLGKQKKEKWGETDFDTLNVPSLTQLEKEVYQKQLLADEWEVDSLEAISDVIMNERKNNQGLLKKIEKEVRYDKKTDTYIAIEKESVRELKKKQERLCAIRIWEEEQEEGEREEMMLLKQKSKRKTDDWDIEEQSLFRKTTEEIEVCKVNDIIAIQKEWTKIDENKDIKEDAKTITIKSDKRVKKSRWDMGSQSEEKSIAKDIWEEEYTEWSKINKYEQGFEKTKKGEFCPTNYSESSSKSDLIDFYHRKPQNIELLEKWTSDEVANRPVQIKKDIAMKHLIPANEKQFASIKEHQTREQFKEISESDIKFNEKTIELYSPSSPALSQKSQDVEVSNESSSCNSLLHEKRKKEMLITAGELTIPTSEIPLQLTIVRDIKQPSSEKMDNILNTVQLDKDKNSAHNFDIKTVDNLFDDISINEPCPTVLTSEHMDIFAEYGSEKPCDKQHAASSNVSSVIYTKDDETNEGKNALKLIPKQLLIRRTNEKGKPKRILETPLQDPAQHAAALLTIQKKLLESHALKNDIGEYPNENQTDHFEQSYSNRDTTANNSRTDNTLLDTTEFSVVSKSSVIVIQQSRSPESEKAISVQSEQSENYDKRSKNDDIKRYKTNRNLNDNVLLSIRSPVREHRKRSPSKKENEKRYSHDKDKKERKLDDVEKPDRSDIRSSKTDFTDRRRSSPSGRERKRKSRSPYVSWERQESRSPGHSWSRSRSKSPKRKDEATTSTRDKDKKRYDHEGLYRSRTDERKERYTRSSSRFSYNEDKFKKHSIVSSKSNRNDWGRRRHDNTDTDHEKDVRLYDPMEILRERTIESEKYRDNRFHTEELDHTSWQYESSSLLRDGNESIDSYTIEQDLPLEYDDRSYCRERSLERDLIQSSSQLSKYRKRSNAKRERQWEKDKDLSDLNHLGHRLRNRTLSRSRYSPVHQTSERFRQKSRSRSRSWSPRSRTRSRSRSGSRSRSTSRSRPRMRSQSRSRSRSPFDIRSRRKSTSMSRLRSPEYSFRMSELRSSRSPSPGRNRLNELERERTDDDENKKFNGRDERGRRIETIVQAGIISGTNTLDSEMGINSNMDAAVTNFQYPNEIESVNEYYYTENNLTYPPCIDESSVSSPKRLSLDDRLELELGIKKQHSKDSTGIASEYSSNFNPNVIVYPSPPQQQQQMMYRKQPTVVQVGNVLQVVPADFNGVQSCREISATTATLSVRSGSSQVVRVGNVLQVVPTSLDWNSSSNGGSGQSSSTDQSSGILYSSTVPAHSPSASMSVPVPIPLPVPPALPTATNTLAPVATVSPATPLPLSLPIPVPVPVPIPSTTAFPRNEVQSQKIIQPVYNYEAILETRRKEQEERKRLRELRRKEKERRRIERVNRRALRLLEKSNTSRQMSEVLLDHRKGDPSVLKALKEGEEQAESPLVNPIKEEVANTFIKEEDEDTVADEEEDDEDEIEAEAEDDEEEEEEAEDEDEDDDDDEKSLQMINQRIEFDEATFVDAIKNQVEIETRKEWPKLPPPPLKGILVVPGFSPNGLDLSDADDNIKDSSGKDEEIDKNNECDKDIESNTKSDKSNLSKLKKTKRNKKSVQFADGVKPGEGTSPSGGEGDMPSPPPPKGIGFREGFEDLRRDKIYSSRKSRKQEKRARPPKAKKKVKVKIIKLKKPRITPLTAMMMDDSDEIDDRSPPPPPPGSPPPPHLWPNYLSIYNTTVRAVEQSQTTPTTLTSVQAPPPPTPLPLLIPPPPLNYTIHPCNKS